MENGQLQKVGKGKGGWIKVFFRKKTKQNKEASAGNCLVLFLLIELLSMVLSWIRLHS